jgi:hypothetical protein
MWWLLTMTVMVAMWSREEEKEERGLEMHHPGPLHFQHDHAVWGSIQTTDDCFPHPYWIYEKYLITFICCG